MSNETKDEFSWVTNEMFDAALRELCAKEDLLTVPGVYEIVQEHFNNDVLAKLEEERDDE